MSERLPEIVYAFTLENGGEATWYPQSFKLKESLFELYELSLYLVTDDLEANVEDVLGATAELELQRGELTRFVTGVVRQVEFLGIEHDKFTVRVKIVPAMWGLTQRKDSRHWQNLTVPEILEEVLAAPLAEYGREIRLDLNNSYQAREFCVQYREYDYDFVRRLMAEEGIYFYFDCAGGQSEVLVLVDSNDVLPEVVVAEAGATIAICNADPLFVQEETIESVNWKRRLDSTAVVQRDFDWVLAPDAPPNDEYREPDTRGFEREIYSPGKRRFASNDTAALAKSKLRSLVVKGTVGRGSGNVSGFAPGFHFALDDHSIPEVVTEHLLIEVVHEGTWQQATVTSSSTGTTYKNTFKTIPFDVPYYPLRTTARPTVSGPQTAIVTGPGSEEIHVDEYGRVKVHLVWDRLSAVDDTSSCWVRVAQLSAGAGFGTMFIPRVGMEVLVEFLDGNPDRPLITGCVFNGNNATPYGLPGDKTRSTIKTNTSPGGGGSNEVRFEDAAGSEELYLHAQKDFTIATGNDKNQTTGNNETAKVGSSRTRSVKANETESIGKNKKIKVGANHTESIGSNRTLTVGASETCTIVANQTCTVSSMATETVAIAKATTVGAAYALTVGAAINVDIGAAWVEDVGAARIVTVGAVSSEDVDDDKKIKAMKMSFKTKKTYGASAGANFKAKVKGDVKIKSTKSTGITAADDLTIKTDKKGKITIKDELTFICGKASLTLQKDGSVIINGKKIQVKAKSKMKLEGKSVSRN